MPIPATLAATTTFLCGAAILILEIAGLKMLAPAFGSSFYVWTGQIAVVMVALAIGYYGGGVLIDRWPTPRLLAVLILIAGIATLLLPLYARPMSEAIANRHYPPVAEAPSDGSYPVEEEVHIAPLWVKLDPMLGSFAAFFLPCLMLGGVSPGLVRLMSRGAASAGTGVGWILAWGTLGSIAGIFASAYWLIDAFALSAIMRGTGGALIALAVALLLLARGSSQEP